MTDFLPPQRRDFLKIPIPNAERTKSLPGVGHTLVDSQDKLAAYNQAAEEMGVKVTVLQQRGLDQEEPVYYQPQGWQGDPTRQLLEKGSSFVRLNYPLENDVSPKPGLINSFFKRVDTIMAEKSQANTQA